MLKIKNYFIGIIFQLGCNTLLHSFKTVYVQKLLFLRTPYTRNNRNIYTRAGLRFWGCSGVLGNAFSIAQNKIRYLSNLVLISCLLGQIFNSQPWAGTDRERNESSETALVIAILRLKSVRFSIFLSHWGIASNLFIWCVYASICLKNCWQILLITDIRLRGHFKKLKCSCKKQMSANYWFVCWLLYYVNCIING